MSLLDKPEKKTLKPGQEDPAKWSIYRCSKCPYTTKQRKGLPQVTHPCKTGARGGTTQRNLKEDT